MRHTGRLHSYICGIHSQEVPSPMAAAPAMSRKTFFQMGEKLPDHDKPYNTVPSNPTDSWPFCAPTTTTSTLVPDDLSSYPHLDEYKINPRYRKLTESNCPPWHHYIHYLLHQKSPWISYCVLQDILLHTNCYCDHFKTLPLKFKLLALLIPVPFMNSLLAIVLSHQPNRPTTMIITVFIYFFSSHHPIITGSHPQSLVRHRPSQARILLPSLARHLHPRSIRNHCSSSARIHHPRFVQVFIQA
jgi:hypothetical protein